MAPPPPPATSPPPFPPRPAAPARSPPSQVLIYHPDGPLGGTFTCGACGAQAWQPDLLVHAAACVYRSVSAP